MSGTGAGRAPRVSFETGLEGEQREVGLWPGRQDAPGVGGGSSGKVRADPQHPSHRGLRELPPRAPSLCQPPALIIVS